MGSMRRRLRRRKKWKGRNSDSVRYLRCLRGLVCVVLVCYYCLGIEAERFSIYCHLLVMFILRTIIQLEPLPNRLLIFIHVETALFIFIHVSSTNVAKSRCKVEKVN